MESFGEAIALEQDARRISYRELATLSEAFAARLPASPQLVAVQACNRIETVAAYLGCLRAGHPVILLNRESIADGRVISAYQPGWLFSSKKGQWRLERLNESEPADFADELAVMLSTSGTTGAPKLVKLSRGNIQSNAEAIAAYLQLSARECAITTLNFFYSYGMAVLNSHLAAGARIVLTDLSVVTPEFWSLFRSSGTTSLAFVPYHFELLERTDFLGQDLPSLRYITQAGGRLHPDRLKRFATQARQRQWQFFVMYGQTEASPRMSYVPPEDLLENLESVGRPIPGGELVIIDEEGNPVTAPGRAGELVYRGPNVMLGYAETRADLARPRDTFELRTGDMAELQPNGYVRITGRLKRFIKLYGLRINLDDLEGRLAQAGYQVYCVGTDETLGIFFEGEIDEEALLDTVVRSWGLRRPDIHVRKLREIPLLPSGKVDYARLNAQLLTGPETGRPRSVQEAFAEAFGEDVSGDDTFISLEGDSILFLHLSLSLEQILGYVPAGWEKKSVNRLEAMVRRKPGKASVPAETLVRCLAIFGIITNHLGTLGEWGIAGGAVALMFLSGLSVARIHGARLAAGRVFEFLKASLLRILVVYYVIITAIFVALPQEFAGQERSWYLLYANMNMRWDALYPFWFVCAYAQLAALVALPWLIPPLRHIFRERQELFGYLALGAGGVLSYWASRNIHGDFFFMHPLAIGYVFALGWCAYFAADIYRKAALSAVLVISILLFWTTYAIQFKLFFGFLVLSSLWLKNIPLPRPVAKAALTIASASFFIYIFHIFPVEVLLLLDARESWGPLPHWIVGVSAALFLGIAADRAFTGLEHLLRSWLSSRREAEASSLA
ncbi:AMP-binding protein [Hyphomonas sp. NPDC076900]|uniref:AMP-binding protein n=1 Tax=Hyphomonas sp. NPDC076900 TaxID=3390570 RepID=UPI003D015A5B